MRFAVLGAGSWGSSLAQVLLDNKHSVVIYDRNVETIKEIKEKKTNTKYFPSSVVLPSELETTTDLKDAIEGAEGVVIAVPSAAYRSILEELASLLDHKVYIVSCAKGYDQQTEKRLSDTIREIIPSEMSYPIVSLIGPSHAEEVILRMLTCVTSTCLDLDTAKVIQSAFSNSYFRVYNNTDEIGAENAAAIKNVIAIASGIVAGLGYGDNTKAALITRGLAEILRFGQKEGGKITTYLGLTGIGDLMVTCTSLHSRNFQAGYKIGKDDGAEIFLKENKMTVEGIRTCKIVLDKAKKDGIDMPVVKAVYDVLYNGCQPSKIVEQLMLRPLKNEFE